MLKSVWKRRIQLICLGCSTCIIPVLGSAQVPRFDLPVMDVEFVPNSPDMLLAAMDGKGAFMMTLPNGPWQEIGERISSPRILAVAASPSNSKRLYIGTKGVGVYRSEDGGVTWREVNRGLENSTISQVLTDPEHPDTLYLLSPHGGVYRSTNAGESWSPINEGLSFGESLALPQINQFRRLVLVSGSRPALFVGTKFGVYRRWLDGTAKWEFLAPLGENLVRAIAADPAGDNIYAVSGRTLYRSGDFGRSWKRAGNQTWGLALELAVMVPGEQLFASVRGERLLKSTDKGETWTSVSDGLPERDVTALGQDPHHPGTLYAGVWGRGVYRSVDWGRQWQPMETTGLAEGMPPAFRATRPPVPQGATAPPASFYKCNVCHGWVDPVLNTGRHVSFYVQGTPRDWVYTVRRMNEEEKAALGPTHVEVLTPPEEAEVILFLQQYFGAAPKKP